jgi:TonB family protein
MLQEHRVVCSLALLFFLLAGTVVAQSPTDAERARKSALNMIHGREVPEATLPCTPEEATWWDQLRKAAKAVQDTKGGRKEKEKYLALVQQGQEKSFQPPVADRPALVLSRTQPRYNEAARRKFVKGSIALVVQLRADGYVGEVEVVQGLEPGLDQNAIDAARQTIFLPRIKDRKFVPFLLPVTMSFNIY